MSGLLFLAGPMAIGAVFGAVILIDRARGARRDPRRPVAVVDTRTYRDARLQVERLVYAGDWRRAHAVSTAICAWLKDQRHYGSRRRRTRLTADYQLWTARQAEYNPAAAL